MMPPVFSGQPLTQNQNSATLELEQTRRGGIPLHRDTSISEQDKVLCLPHQFQPVGTCTETV